MRSLTKVLKARRDEVASRLQAAEESLRAVLEEANAFRQEVVDMMDDYAGARSEKWQESEASDTYETWKAEWEEELFEDEEINASQLLRELPDAPG